MSVKSKYQKVLNELEMFFQPIVNVNTLKCFGVEALVGNISSLGYSNAGDLLDCADADGELFDTVEIILEQVFEQVKMIPEEYREYLFVNLDNRIFGEPKILCEAPKEAIKKHNLGETKLCFEISERDKFSYSQLKFRQEIWKNNGIGIAIDDFGTGISGIELLYYCDTDFLKIDRFLVSGLHLDLKKQILVKNIINMADELNVQVIAEGIEDEKEYLFLKELGVVYQQGFYFSRPKSGGSDFEIKLP